MGTMRRGNKTFLACLICIISLAGCKTRTVVVTVPEVRTDTTYITKQQRDSIWLHDSIYVNEYQKGDTVFKLRDRWHTKYIESIKHDTIYNSTHDTIAEIVPVEVVKEVPAKLSWWQKTRMNVGVFALLVLLCWIIWESAKLYLKRF